MADPNIDKPVDIKTLRKLLQEGLLSEEAFLEASKIIRPISNWFAWAKKTLLLVGCGLVLSGVIFFFAFNWAAMGKFFKFFLIEFGIIVCLIFSYIKDNKSLTSKILLLSASVFVGVLLAVYGQTYQTGADAFGLFIGWAGLIFGFVLVSEFAALWLIWLILLNTGLILYWQQVGQFSFSLSYEYLCLSLAILNGIALTLREIGLQKGLIWLEGKWLRSVLLITILVNLSIPTIDEIVDIGYRQEVSSLLSLAWIAAIGGSFYFYRYKLRDMISIATIVMNVCVILLVFIGKIMFSNNYWEGGIFLSYSIIIVGVITGAVFLLKFIARSMENEEKEVPK